MRRDLYYLTQCTLLPTASMQKAPGSDVSIKMSSFSPDHSPQKVDPSETASLTKPPRSTVSILILVGLVIAAVFLADLLSPLGVSISFLYVMAILITAWPPGPLIPIVTAVVCTALTLLAVALTAGSFAGNPLIVLLNRGLTIAVIWIVTGAVLNRKHSEETLESIIQGSPIGQILIDSIGRIQVMNRQAESLFGYGADEWIGMAVEHLVPERFQAKFLKLRTELALAARTARSRGQGQALIARRKDGMEFPIELAVSPARTSTGKATLLSIVSVSEREASQALLRIHARQQGVVADLGQFALEVSDLDEVLNQVVVRLAETLDVEFCKILELMPNGKQLRLRAGVGWREGLVGSATVGTEPASQAGFTLMCHSSVIVEDLRSEPRFSGTALLTDHGIVSGMSCIIAGAPNAPYGVLGVHTAHKRSFSQDDVHFLESIANVVAQSVQRFYAETERIRSVEELRRSRDMFLNLIQNNPFGVYLVDSGFRLAQMSTGSQKIFGNVHSLIGRDFAEILRAIWPEPFASHAIERFCHTLATGEPYHSTNTTERRDDTAEVETYDWRIDRVTLPDGQFGVVCYLYDMTERARQEAEVHRLKDELETRVVERTHELMEKQEQLRTMAAELTLTEQRERRRLATDLHDYLAQLLVVGRMKLGQLRNTLHSEHHGKTLQDIDHVLDQSLTYTKSLVAELSPHVLYQFGLSKALEFLGDQMRQHGLLVQVDSDTDSLPLSESQAVLLFQSVRELLFNIVKYAKTDHASVSLTTQSNGEICIRVSDEGQGFDLAAAAGKRSLSMGFGHFSIQERMNALKGRLTIDSSPGRGTRVTLVLPYESKGLVKTTQSQSKVSGLLIRERGASDRPSEFTVRVLLVDDHAMVREGVRTSLETHGGFEIVGEAVSGTEAMELAHVLNPDAIVMDVNMPGINGIEATQRITSNLPSVRVIALSVNTDESTRSAMLNAGAKAFLGKDVAGDELCRVLDELMADRIPQT
ncbi:MAG: membrane protein of unknown function [Candidatus Nitrospira kreftii]|uniref:Histidine kinase n=1 Tax=Candidatus Nitrospira kreftii TaxID=2652173 RepID=A0A7S8FET1_9BACT|nr:MAG: membrane protein of unknown function [Candidatus Nitrospira kreftii]